MSDSTRDLVERLRAHANWYDGLTEWEGFDNSEILREAASAIEALDGDLTDTIIQRTEALRTHMQAWIDHHHERAEALQKELDWARLAIERQRKVRNE